MDHFILLLLLGVMLGALGTLIGAGGGFVLVPVLLLLYPHDNPETITSISLAVVFFNALSGSWSYARMGRIDYKSGLIFAAATIPGAILGAYTTGFIPRHLFNGVLGIFMIAASIYLCFKHTDTAKNISANKNRLTIRKMVEKNGSTHTYSYNRKLGIIISLFVGYLSSLMGIGGGIIHVPALIQILNFPVHIATATSHFILAIMALTGTIVHIVNGSFAHGGVYRTIFLGSGVLFGAQIGAWLSNRVHASWITRGLAIALGLVGIRIFIMALIP